MTYDEIVNIVNSVLNTTDIKIIQVLFFDIFYDNKIHILDKLSLIKNSGKSGIVRFIEGI